MQVANPNRAQFQKNSIFIPSDFPHFLKSTIGKELAPSKSAPVTPSPILLARHSTTWLCSVTITQILANPPFLAWCRERVDLVELNDVK